MTMQVKDIPEAQADTPATRLRQAREIKGFSRAELSRQTGIPAKSIEKFEYGSQEPSLSRVLSLSAALNVSTQWIMGSEDEFPVGIPSAPETVPEAPSSPPIPVNENDPETQAVYVLETLDDMRGDAFEDVARKAMALIENVQSLLRYLEPNELMALAEDRGLYKGECPTPVGLLDIFAEDPLEGQEYCGSIEDRIIDTAVLGVDLFAVDREPLVSIADHLEEEHGIEQPRFFSWGDHEDFVPVIRLLLRSKAISGNGLDFNDQETFPRRR